MCEVYCRCLYALRGRLDKSKIKNKIKVKPKENAGFLSGEGILILEGDMEYMSTTAMKKQNNDGMVTIHHGVSDVQ